MSLALHLTEELFAQPFVSPHAAACQAIIARRLAAGLVR